MLLQRGLQRNISHRTFPNLSKLPVTFSKEPLKANKLLKCQFQLSKQVGYNFRSFSTSVPRDNAVVPSPAETTRTSNTVAYWLIGTSGLVFGIVVLGGLTRLTESGLSITEWKPVTGTLPPMNQKEWEEEFSKYKESPEFKQLNSHINLDEFKFIFFMEWVHRLWGRAIGVVFIAPAIYFAVRKRTSSHVNKRLLYLTSILGLQGFIGWWMVKSGLDQEQLDERRSKPTVSQYRLTTHLGAAFFLYMGMLYTGLDILKENKWVKNPDSALKLFKRLNSSSLNSMRKFSIIMLAASFITAMSGGMVAGLDAGWIYNTFPKMGETWIPSNRELFDDNFARREDKSDLWWRNLLENPTTVQLIHRIFAISTFTGVVALHMVAIKKKQIMPRNAQMNVHTLMGVVTLQLCLGICTLWYYVPVHLASTHQAGALALVTSALILVNQLRKPRANIKNIINNVSIKQAGVNNPSISKKILTETAKLASK
ncbi:hypothetical protein KAFR_0B02280 [Kazachstania africana CBS 2517]|uniref:Cytochrome c oxidase assembly protein COX15 n=1 Tax=Kazachstania africana (strain ATCC 22294 / BCRC 22015 / CBS 2517 / CECT 1963 / NBRC 1671 / NRRL Y-8276) TaxID=1071382 RepID=H2AQ76_KAZAF|nr:hypothetical protein KAFR_0B02280 [Kazachstania africana CBS 2517]CCF56526.1 hypothetical protein KAFR_0B02280 [Kazachstania africana CBS 2517]